jgi:NAD-dependent DNA ligase
VTDDTVAKSAPAEELAGIPGIGPVVGQSVYQFFHSAVGNKTIKELDELGLGTAQDQ